MLHVSAGKAVSSLDANTSSFSSKGSHNCFDGLIFTHGTVLFPIIQFLSETVLAFGGVSPPRFLRSSFPVLAVGLPSPTMPSADFSRAVRKDCSLLSQYASLAMLQGTREISQGKTRNFQCISAGFIKHTHFADACLSHSRRRQGGLRSHACLPKPFRRRQVPARPECTTPHIRFLFVALHLWIGVGRSCRRSRLRRALRFAPPPDPTSR